MNDNRPRRFERAPSPRATILDASPQWQERLLAQQAQRAAEARSAGAGTDLSRGAEGQSNGR
jgi:hypothetical protein